MKQGRRSQSLDRDRLKSKALEDALITGEQSGAPEPFDNADFVRRMRLSRVMTDLPEKRWPASKE